MIDKIARLQGKHGCLQRRKLLLQLYIFLQNRCNLFFHLGNPLQLQIGRNRMQRVILLREFRIGIIPCLGRDTANTGADALLTDDLADTDFLCVIHMTAAAEFLGNISHADNADNIPVFFIKQCGRSAFLCFLNRHFHFTDRIMSTDIPVYQTLDFLQLFLVHLFKMRKVKAQIFLTDKAAGLLDMTTHDLLQSTL